MLNDLYFFHFIFMVLKELVNNIISLQKSISYGIYALVSFACYIHCIYALLLKSPQTQIVHRYSKLFLHDLHLSLYYIYIIFVLNVSIGEIYLNIVEF